MKLNLMYDKKPKVGQKFIAILDDGSGCQMYIRESEKIYVDSEGCLRSDEEIESNYIFWIDIPSKIKFWYEYE